MKLEWILAAAFNEIDEDFNLLTVEKTNTLNSAGYDIVVKAQIKTENFKKNTGQQNAGRRDVCLCVTNVRHGGIFLKNRGKTSFCPSPKNRYLKNF